MAAEKDKARTTRELAAKTGCAESTLRRKLKRWRMSKGPWAVAEVMAKLADSPPDPALKRSKPSAEPSPLEQAPDDPPPLDSPAAFAPTLAQLEGQILKTRNRDEAERLSKQVRSLKAMQEVMERDGKLIDAEKARREIETCLTLFQTTLMGWPKTIAAALVGVGMAECETILEGKFTELLAELRRGMEHAIHAEPEAVRGDVERVDTSDEAAAQPVG